MPTNRPHELRAYAIAIALFVILHLALTKLTDAAAMTAAGIDAWMPYLNAIAYLLYAAAGFVAGALTNRHHALNGLVTGFLAAAVAVLLFGAGPGADFGTAILLLNGAIIGGVGGACSLLIPDTKPAPDREHPEQPP
jgi:sugar phosphate permease